MVESFLKTARFLSRMESIVCLILARGGSKRIKNKNLCRINGTSLILRCLQTVTRVKGFSEVWVSTDSPEIEEESRQISCVKIHRRASYASLDSASSLCAVKEFLESHTGITTLALVQCTSPFLRICDLDEACLKMSCPACDSVFSVKTDKALRWKTKDGISQPVNFNPAQRPRSQDMEAEFVETGGFYFFRTYLTERNLLQGPRAEMVIVPEELSIDIDTEIDLKLAQVLDENLGVMLL